MTRTDSRIAWLQIQNILWMYCMPFVCVLLMTCVSSSSYVLWDAWHNGLTECFRFVDPSFRTNVYVSAFLLPLSSTLVPVFAFYFAVKSEWRDAEVSELRHSA